MPEYGTHDRVLVAVLSDTHANHKLGLLHPDTIIHDEDPETGDLVAHHPKLGPAQEFLHQAATEDFEATKALADGDYMALVHLGDMCQGANGNGRELVSSRMSDQFAIAAANLRPWFELPNLMRAVFIKGTAYHEFGEGSAALTVAAMLRPEFPYKPIEVPYHADAEVRGLKFDLAHHGPPPGVRNWLRGNVLRLYGQGIMDDALMNSERPPDVMLRGHYHQLVTEWVTRRNRERAWEMFAGICPSYCMIDDYARKVAKSPDKVTVGMLVLEIIGGRLLQVHEFKRTIDFRTKVVLA